MPSIYVAIPSPATLEQNTTKFLDAMKSGSREPQAPVFTQIAFEFVDLQLEALFHGPMRQIELTPFRKRMFDGLGSLVEKTTHGLIKTVVAKLSNDELKGLAPYVAERRIYLDGVPHVSWPLTQHFTTRFEALHEATMSGNRDNVDAQIEVMNEFIDVALDYMFSRPTSMIKLGFIARKGVDLGHSSIRSLSHTTVRKMATDLSLEENQRMSTYFYGLMKEGPDYKGG